METRNSFRPPIAHPDQYVRSKGCIHIEPSVPPVCGFNVRRNSIQWAWPSAKM